MSLQLGTGPFSPHRSGWAVPPLPEGGVTWVEPHPRRVQATVAGEVVLDTEAALLVHRPGSTLTYAFPADVVAATGLPSTPEPLAPGYVQVPWEAADGWIEEGRRWVTYPANPYHRVDCRPTRRRLAVDVAGTTLVDSDDTLILFETSLEPKLYVARSHVRTDLLHRSDTTSWCNYKGWATYWSTTDVDDVAWSYDDPLPESSPVAGMLSFDAERVNVLAELPPPFGDARPG